MEQPKLYTANIQTSPVILEQLEVNMLEVGAPIQETVEQAAAVCRETCQLADQCRLNLEAVREAGTVVLRASCSECPNPDIAFGAPQMVRGLAQDRLAAVRAVTLPDVATQEKPSIVGEPQPAPEDQILEVLETAGLPREWKSALYYNEDTLVGEQRLVEVLELGVRNYNILKRAGLQTVFDVVTTTEEQLRSLPNMGRRGVDEIAEALGKLGLQIMPESEERRAERLQREAMPAITLGKIAEERKAQAEQPTDEANDETQTGNDELSSPEQEAEKQAKEAVIEAMEWLSYRERRVLELRYGLDEGKQKTYKDIGTTFRISTEYTRQIENLALKKVQAILDAKK